MIRFLVISTTLWGLSLLYATESPPSVAHRDPWVQEGKLFVVKLVPGDKNMKIMLVGKEAVDLDWKSTDLKVTLDLGKNLKRRLKILKKDSFFTIEDDLAKENQYRLEVQTMHKGVSDTVKFDIDNKKK